MRTFGEQQGCAFNLAWSRFGVSAYFRADTGVFDLCKGPGAGVGTGRGRGVSVAVD
jgi:hypothetical protein